MKPPRSDQKAQDCKKEYLRALRHLQRSLRHAQEDEYSCVIGTRNFCLEERKDV